MDSRFYNDHLQLPFIGKPGLDRLQAARVLVVGAGGLGCPVIAALAASGIGQLGIFDGDKVEHKNLARQHLYAPAQVGTWKTAAACEHVQTRYPNTTCQAYPFFVDDSNAPAIFADYDLIVDATDNFPSRLCIGHASAELDKPVVYGAIFRSEIQITVFEKGMSHRTIDDLFTLPAHTASTPCAVSGTYVIGSMVAGTLMANEVIKILLDLPGKLTGRLLLCDVLSLQQRVIHLSGLPTQPSERIAESHSETHPILQE